MHFVPKTRLGKISVILILLMFLFLVLMMIIVQVQVSRANQTFFDNLWLSIPGFLGMASGITSFATGLISIIKRKERSIFVYISTFIGMMMLWFLIGEAFG